jgi:hypothetical protein
MAVEIVDRRLRLEGIIAVPAQELAHMGPIFLLDVCVVVFLIWSAAGELDLAPATVLEEMGIDELGAVVGIEAAERKGERGVQRGDGGADGALGLAQDGVGLDPASMDIGEIEGLQKLAVGPIAGMGDEVDLGEAGRGDVPVLRADGDVVFEQGAGLRAPYSRRRMCRLRACRRRSMVRGLIRRNCRSKGGGMAKRRRAQGSHSGSNAWRRVDQG